MGCPRTYCQGCGEEMIHRDHRRSYESASCLGQIVSREGPLKLGFMDMDGVSRKGLKDGSQLLRILEHKQLNAHLKANQEETLKLIAQIIEHCVKCPSATSLKLHPNSGLYIVRGELTAASNGAHKTMFNGPQEITRYVDGISYTVTNEEGFFRFLDPVDRERRGTS